MFPFLSPNARLRHVLLLLRAEKTSDPRPDIARLLFFAVSLMDIGLPQKHAEPVLFIFDAHLNTRCIHNVYYMILNVLRMSTKKNEG